MTRAVEPDVVVGNKAVDIVVPYNEQHRGRLDEILAVAHPVGNTPPPALGTIIGIEIETDPAATAENNARKNHEAGITTITAVIKDVLGTIAVLQDTLPAPVQDRTLVIDAFDLLEELRTA